MPHEKRFTCISVERSVRDRLLRLKEEVGARTWDELLEELLRAYREYRNFRVKQKILKLLCNHYKESSASVIGWVRIVYKHFSSSEEFDTALQILPTLLKKSSSEQEAYVVNREKCREAQEAEV